jgi:hypothetical protein
MMATTGLLVADECWVALATLHRSHPQRESFAGGEILEQLRSMKMHETLRAGLQPHIYLHNVANVAPNPAKHRLFYRLPNGAYRLFRPGDDYHPARTGKTAPNRRELPSLYHGLLDWYETEYCGHRTVVPAEEDPVLQMRGVGKELWAEESGDTFVERLRAGWFAESTSTPNTDADQVWDRIVDHAGQPFSTTPEAAPFTYSIEAGRRLAIFRGRDRLEPAFDEWFAVLTDPRIGA